MASPVAHITNTPSALEGQLATRANFRGRTVSPIPPAHGDAGCQLCVGCFVCIAVAAVICLIVGGSLWGTCQDPCPEGQKEAGIALVIIGGVGLGIGAGAAAILGIFISCLEKVMFSH